MLYYWQWLHIIIQSHLHHDPNQSREVTTIIASTYICCVFVYIYQPTPGKWLIACPRSVQSFRSQLDVPTSSPSQSSPDLQSTIIRSLSVWCYHFQLLAFWLLAQAAPPPSRPHGSSQYIPSSSPGVMLSPMASPGTSKHLEPIPSQDPQHPEKVSQSKLHKDVIQILPGSHETSEEVETVTPYVIIGHMVCTLPPPQATAIIQLSPYLDQIPTQHL